MLGVLFLAHRRTGVAAAPAPGAKALPAPLSSAAAGLDVLASLADSSAGRGPGGGGARA